MDKRIAAVMMGIGLCVATAQAGLNATGDVDPADPATWTSSTDAHIGETGEGSLAVTNGGTISSWTGHIGTSAGSTGTVTISGVGSTWTSTNWLYVSRGGDGTLSITDGATVTSFQGFIGDNNDSVGAVTVSNAGSRWTTAAGLRLEDYATLTITDGGVVENGGMASVSVTPDSRSSIHFDNGTLTTKSLMTAPGDLTGTGTINTNGLLSDLDLIFDATHGLTQVLTLNDPGQNITINLDTTRPATIGAGYGGDGSLLIADSMAVLSSSGFLAHQPGSMGVATVTGEGSTWTTGTLNVAFVGDATLAITDGGTVNCTDGYIGREDAFTGGGPRRRSIGVATVSGAGSTWVCSDDLSVGVDGDGTLNILHGGLVKVADRLTIQEDNDGSSFVNMATGGMLALYGQADGSLFDFMANIHGQGPIRYWDDGTGWADITGATYGDDYTLSYLTAGDLAGYTVLTVPEPATLSLLALGGLALLRKGRA